MPELRESASELAKIIMIEVFKHKAGDLLLAAEKALAGTMGASLGLLGNLAKTPVITVAHILLDSSKLATETEARSATQKIAEQARETGILELEHGGTTVKFERDGEGGWSAREARGREGSSMDDVLQDTSQRASGLLGQPVKYPLTNGTTHTELPPSDSPYWQTIPITIHQTDGTVIQQIGRLTVTRHPIPSEGAQVGGTGPQAHQSFPAETIHMSSQALEEMASNLAQATGQPIGYVRDDGTPVVSFPAEDIHLSPEAAKNAAQQLATATGDIVTVQMSDGSPYMAFPNEEVGHSDAALREMAVQLASASGNSLEVQLPGGGMFTAVPESMTVMTPQDMQAMANQLAASTGQVIELEMADGSKYLAFPAEVVSLSDNSIRELASQIAAATGHPVELQSEGSGSTTMFPPDHVSLSNEAIQDLASHFAVASGQTVELTMPDGSPFIALPAEELHLSDAPAGVTAEQAADELTELGDQPDADDLAGGSDDKQAGDSGAGTDELSDLVDDGLSEQGGTAAAAEDASAPDYSFADDSDASMGDAHDLAGQAVADPEELGALDDQTAASGGMTEDLERESGIDDGLESGEAWQADDTDELAALDDGLIDQATDTDFSNSADSDDYRQPADDELADIGGDYASPAGWGDGSSGMDEHGGDLGPEDPCSAGGI